MELKDKIVYLVVKPNIVASKQGYWYKKGVKLLGVFEDEEDIDEAVNKVKCNKYTQHEPGKFIIDKPEVFSINMNTYYTKEPLLEV